jgi:SAM-dependent methyltransferase
MQDSQSKVDQKLEYIPCRLCGKSTFDKVLTSQCVNSHSQHLFAEEVGNVRERFDLARCNNCGLQQVNPRPVKKHIGRYYSEDYYAHTSLKSRKLGKKSSLLGKWIGLKDDIRRLIRIRFYNYPPGQKDDEKGMTFLKTILLWFFYLTYRSRLDVIPFTGKGRLLDIGCGNGRYLSTMKKLGWQVSGVEKNPKASKYAREELHLDVNTGDLLDYKYQDKSFDAVTMWHSLEHLYEPLQTLKEVSRILNNDGLLVVAAPNIDSFVAKIFKTYWYGLQLPIHLIAFTPDSIAKMLNQAGFDVKKICYDRRSSTLRLSLLNLKDEKYRFFSKLSRFKGTIRMVNFILAMFKSCDIIVIHAQKKTSCDV